MAKTIKGMNSLGRFIRNKRKSKQWTLDDLEYYSGVSRAVISRIERGDRNPKLTHLKAIADAFDYPYEVLVYLSLDEDSISDKTKRDELIGIKDLIEQVMV